MVVQHNLRAMNSNRMLGVTSSQQSKSTEKLSSGFKINRAADDAAGLSISEKMRKQIRGLDQASTNASDGISAVQTAEGAMVEVHDMLQRMNELAVKAANDTLTTQDRSYIHQEIVQLSDEITRTAASTEFNNQHLLDGTFTNKNLQVGSETDSMNQINICIVRLSATSIGVGAVLTADESSPVGSANGNNQINVYSHSNAKASIEQIKQALISISKQRSDLGAIQNRLEHTIANLDNVVENTTSAESRIRDTDMATEMVKFSNQNILQQAGQAMLAQANQSNQGVLSLLG